MLKIIGATGNVGKRLLEKSLNVWHDDVEAIATRLDKDNLDYNFYFVSRQKNKKFLVYWTNKFNIDYKKNLKVSDKRYWICNSTKFNCCQVLAYDEQYKIPFRSEHEL